MAQEITQGLFSNLFETKIPRMGTQSSPFGGILQQQPITISGGGMSPISAITQRIMQSGEQLQGSVRGLFGQQTPEQAQQTMVTQLIKNNPDVNLNEPEGLRRMAREAMNVPGLEMFSIKLRQQADVLEEKQKVAKRQATKEELTIQKLEKEIETIGIPKPNVLSDSEMLIAQGLGIPTNDNFGNPRDITSYTQEESNAILKKKEEQKRRVAEASAGKKIETSLSDVSDALKTFGLTINDTSVQRLEAIGNVKKLLNKAFEKGVGGAIIPSLQRAFVRLSEGDQARMSDKDVERILGIENFVDQGVSALEQLTSGTLTDKKIKSLTELLKIYERDSIEVYNNRKKAYNKAVEGLSIEDEKKQNLINIVPTAESYITTRSIPVEQTRVIKKQIEGIGTVTVRIKGNSNTTTQEEKEEQLGTGTLPSRIPQE
jgi:hypothetical protein